MRYIFSTNSDLIFTVDDEDYDYLSQFKWTEHDGYAYGRCGSIKNIFMHRLLMSRTCDIEGKEVDHRNTVRSDNRKTNLRVCTRLQNTRNRGKSRKNTSGYKGVFKGRAKWEAKIRNGDKLVNIGAFDTALEAAIAYDIFARDMHAEFAFLNVVNPDPAVVARVKDVLARPKKRNGKSRYLGVTQNNRGRWIAYISTPKRIYIGSYATELEAAAAVDAAHEQRNTGHATNL